MTAQKRIEKEKKRPDVPYGLRLSSEDQDRLRIAARCAGRGPRSLAAALIREGVLEILRKALAR